MKLHPRVMVVNRAEIEILGALADLATKHDLTDGEMVMILSAALASTARYMIRSERHPNDPSKRGGEA